MRPENLYPLFRPINTLKGVGPRIGALIANRAGPYLVHLLWHIPSGLIDRRHAPKIKDAAPGIIATVTVKVEKHLKPPKEP